MSRKAKSTRVVETINKVMAAIGIVEADFEMNVGSMEVTNGVTVEIIMRIEVAVVVIAILEVVAEREATEAIIITAGTSTGIIGAGADPIDPTEAVVAVAAAIVKSGIKSRRSKSILSWRNQRASQKEQRYY